MTPFDKVRADMDEAMRAAEARLILALFNAPHERLNQLAAVSRPIFGNILTPSPDPLQGLRSLVVGA